MEVTRLVLNLRNAARQQEENWKDILEEKNVKPKRRELEERLGV